MPEALWADGIKVPVEREDAPELRHGDGHDRDEAVVSRRRIRPDGGIGRRPAHASPLHQTTEEPGEPRVQERMHPPTDGPATAAQRVGERGDGPAPRGPQDDLRTPRQVGITADLPTTYLSLLRGCQRG